MLDAVHHGFGTGYVPRRHGDIIDLEAACLASARHTRWTREAPNIRRTPAGRPSVSRHVRPRGCGGCMCVPSTGGGASRVNWSVNCWISRRRTVAVARCICTYPSSPGAEALWRSLGQLVCDERQEGADGGGIRHFGITLGEITLGTGGQLGGSVPRNRM